MIRTFPKTGLVFFNQRIITINSPKPFAVFSVQNIVFNENKDSWYNVGDYEIENDQLVINDLPYNISFSKYAKTLDDLVEKNYIVSISYCNYPILRCTP